MRRRLKQFLPLILIALMVQIFAPIGACWAASIAASDPLAGAVICHGDTASHPGQTDQAGDRAHEGCCSVCSVMQTGAPAAPVAAFVAVAPPSQRVAWLDFTSTLQDAPAASCAQARAPPFLS